MFGEEHMKPTCLHSRASSRIFCLRHSWGRKKEKKGKYETKIRRTLKERENNTSEKDNTQKTLKTQTAAKGILDADEYRTTTFGTEDSPGFKNYKNLEKLRKAKKD